jgi:putative transposase
MCHDAAMARLARAVVPKVPHHVTARGNRREPIFVEDCDQDVYCDILAEQTRKAGVQVWAYRLMPTTST